MSYPWPPQPAGVSVTRAFFVVSTGHCGTSYLAHCLNLAPNAEVVHETDPRMLSAWDKIGSSFWDKSPLATYVVPEATEIPELGWLIDHIRWRLAENEPKKITVYGRTQNDIWPFMLPLYRTFGGVLRFVHLVRNPVDYVQSVTRGNPNEVGQAILKWLADNAAIYKMLCDFPPAMWATVTLDQISGAGIENVMRQLYSKLDLRWVYGRNWNAIRYGDKPSEHYDGQRAIRNRHFDPNQDRRLGADDMMQIRKACDADWQIYLKESYGLLSSP